MNKTITKICSKCKIEKKLGFFSKNKSRADGYSYICKSCDKEYRDNNKERIKKYQKEWRLNNNYKIKKYREDNRGHLLYLKMKWYRENFKKSRAQNSNWYKTDKGKAYKKNKNHKRRSIKKQGDVITQQLLELEQNAKVCYWCNCSLKKVEVHIDHYIPLSKGGEHTLSNLVVSCAKCNQIKNAKDPLTFANSLGRLL